MNKPNTKCRVCGKEYYCCNDSQKNNSWRTMACSKECYSEYIKRIEKSRKTFIEKPDLKPSYNDMNDNNKKVNKKQMKCIIED